MTSQTTIQLIAALGSEGFEAAVTEAEKLPAGELIAIAKEFTGRRATSKRDALRKIRSRHASLVISRRRIESVAGRSAA